MSAARLGAGALAVATLTLTSGCYTTVISSGRPAQAATIAYDERHHGGLVWGMAELGGPYDLSEVCPNGWAEIETETSFVDGLVAMLTRDIYSPQTVTIRCASEGAPPPAAPTTPQPREAPPAPAPAAAPPREAPAAPAATSANTAPAATPVEAAPPAAATPPGPATAPSPPPPAPPPAM